MSTSNLDQRILSCVVGFRPEAMDDFRQAAGWIDSFVGQSPPDMLITIASKDPLLVQEAHQFVNESKQLPSIFERLLTLLADAWKERICKEIVRRMPDTTEASSSEEVEVEPKPEPEPKLEVEPKPQKAKKGNPIDPKTGKVLRGRGPIDPRTGKRRIGRPPKDTGGPKRETTPALEEF